jgi:hypothetical protein
MFWLASTILSATLVVPRPLPLAVPAAASEAVLACDDGTNGGTLVQPGDAAYGNRFAPGCGGGRVLRASFVHFGAGFAGPHTYRLLLLNGDCIQLAATAPLQAPDAAAAPGAVDVDLAALDWCVGGDFVVAVQPMDCTGEAHGCFPALVVDASSHSGDHCGVVVATAATAPTCRSPQSADGRRFDFRLRVDVDCADPRCATPVASRTWSDFKRLYIDPTDPR